MLKHSNHCVRIDTLPKRHHGFIGLLILLATSSGCVSVRSSPVELSLQVDPTRRPGTYTLSGSTNLPDETAIVVQGVRYMKSPASSELDQANYSILSRQVVKVSQGKWQTTLNLWQVMPDGRYQEAWQLTQPRMRVDLQPSSEVTFLAMTEPVGQAQALEQTLQKQGKTLEGNAVRSTPDGQWYLEAKQSLLVKLPDGKTTPGSSADAVTEEFTAGGNSSKFITPVTTNSAQPTLIKQSQTTAPLSTAERLR